MFIQTEWTPNPETMKFLPGEAVWPQGTAEFTSLKEAEKHSPLALRIMEVQGVKSVFLASDFLTVSKEGDVNWENLKPLVLSAIMDHFISGDKVMTESVAPSRGETAIDNAIVKQIIEIIDTRIRPAVAMDGGDIIFHSFESGVVYLEMRGACSGCPSASATLKSGVENMLRYYVPEVREVRAIHG